MYLSSLILLLLQWISQSPETELQSAAHCLSTRAAGTADNFCILAACEPTLSASITHQDQEQTPFPIIAS